MFVKKVIIAAAAAILFFIFVSVIFFAQSSRNTPITRVIKEWGPSVVNISTERTVSLQLHPYWGQYGSIFDNFFNQYQSTVIGTTKLNGLGSGVVISKDGLVVTNAHVVNMASKVYVIFSDGKVEEATLAAINPRMDIAIIKVAPYKALKPVRLAKDVMIGETVISIGNPLGLQNSVAAGIVSATNRSFSVPGAQNPFTGLIQTDASINQGSSGGAILNLEGELVGISLAVVQGAQSIGFAIPAEKISIVMKDYRDAMAKQAPAKQSGVGSRER
jgi:serine protease Do